MARVHAAAAAVGDDDDDDYDVVVVHSLTRGNLGAHRPCQPYLMGRPLAFVAVQKNVLAFFQTPWRAVKGFVRWMGMGDDLVYVLQTVSAWEI